MKKLKQWAWRCLEFLRRCSEAVLKVCFFLLPVKKNKVLLINFNGKGFGCNPKYIAQELLRRELGYDLVWLVQNMEEAFPVGIRKVQYFSAKALYEVATASVIVTNVKNDLRLIKKKGQYIIHTWHGSYSAKLVEREVEDKLTARYVRESKHHSRITDLFLSNSRLLTRRYRDSFWYDGEVLECGFPRNDILFQHTEQQAQLVRQRLGIPTDGKLVLYAPTFRDDGSTEGYAIDHDGVLQTLGENWYLLIRLHPNVECADALFDFGGRVVDATPYPDMQELLMASDILITDYSSTVFEFAAMGKPSFIFASDVEAYQQLRGLKEAFFSMPYPVCRSNRALLEQLQGFTAESGRKMAAEFMAVYGGTDRGDASIQVADRIRSVMEKGSK